MLTVCPGCAGIGYSDDKLLQTRIFSYADTQRHRLGPNYLLLPVNAPKCPHHNNHHDGFMNFMHRDEEVSALHNDAAMQHMQSSLYRLLKSLSLQNRQRSPEILCALGKHVIWI